MQILTTETEKREEIAGDDAIVCVHCKAKPAEIFQVNGEYCLDCWQIITHTNA